MLSSLKKTYNLAKILTILSGLTLILLGLLCNEYFLTLYFSSDLKINLLFYRFIIWGFDILFIIVGVILVLRNNRNNVQKLGVNLSLSLTMIIIIVIVFELIFPYFLPFLPLNLQPFVDSSCRVLCQSSKKGLIPKDYVAIVGDSFAQGSGDWLLNSNYWTNPEFHSAHLINKILKKDVISFGLRGADLIEGFVVEPTYKLEILKKRFKIEDPKLILAYLYEGNDFNGDDLARFRYDERITVKEGLNCNDFNKFLKKIVKRTNNHTPVSYFVATNFFLHLLKHTLGEITGLAKSDTSYETHQFYDKIVVHGMTVLLNSHQLRIPDLPLDGPFKIPFQIFECSLEFLIKQFPNSKIVVVYIPSNSSCYQFLNNELYYKYTKYPAYLVKARSDLLVSYVDKICKSKHLLFLDTRTELRKAALKQAIHGSKDWIHFNKYGYGVLSRTIVSFLRKEKLVN